ncbi:MAG: hypothetical protein Salg2KO_21530 [Salibacteraceae bacterium]
MKLWHQALIGLLAIGLYVNTLSHDYALDDKAIIVHNEFTQKGFAGIPDHFSHSYWYGLNGKDAGNYRPISGVSFSIERGIFGDSPAIGHFFNILFYALMCIVLVRWLHSLEILPTNLLVIALLIFAAHPIHTEVVANIKSRDEIYCLLFFALSAHQFWKWLNDGNRVSLALSGVLFLLSMLSKETSIALLPIFPLMAYRVSKKEWESLKKAWVPFAVTAVYLLLYLSVTDLLQDKQYHVFDNALVQDGSAGELLATKFWILGEYFKLLFVPHPLVYDYSFNTVPLVSFGNFQVIIAILALTAVVAFSIMYAKRRSEKKVLNIAFVLALILFPLVPVSNFIFTIGSTMAERFLFIPSLGMTLLFVFALDALLTRLTINKPAILWGIGAVIVLLFGAQTIDRNKDWENDATLFSADIEHLPNNAKAHHNLANIYKAKAEEAKNQAQRVTFYESAARLLEQAITIYEVHEFHRDLGLIYGELGKWDGVKKSLGRYLEMNPADARSWMQLGLAYGITQDMDNARMAFEKSYALNPRDAEACLNLAKTYAILGNNERARKQVEECGNLDPNNEEIINLARELGQAL